MSNAFLWAFHHRHRTCRHILLAVWVAVPALATAQGIATIRGRVVDQKTGAPLVRATVVAYGVEGGRSWTDSAGRYLLRGLRPGVGMLRVTCPSKTPVGPLTGFDGVVFVQSGRELVLDLSVDVSQCDEPPQTSRYGVFPGRYVPEFESVRFLPCPDSAGRPLLWANSSSMPGAMVQFTEAAARQLSSSWPSLENPSEEPEYYARFRGTLSGPGDYYVWSYKFTIDSLLEFRVAKPDDCR